MKVHELAKELNTSTKHLIDFMKKLDIEVTNHLNVLEEEQIEKVKASFTDNNLQDDSDNIKTNQESNLEKENQELKLKLDKMEEILKQLESKEKETQAKSAQSAQPAQPEVLKKDNITAYDYEDDEIPEIPMNKAIKVMSLFSGGLNLKTTNSGDAQVIRFEYIGQIMPILYQDLVKIIANQRSFFEQGYCMILDKNVVKTHYLEEHYKKFVDGRVINNILKYDVEKIREIVSNTTPVIQQSIVDVIIKKINGDEYVDKNKATAIGELYGNDIFELATKLK